MGDKGISNTIEQANDYVAPVVRVMSESEVLSAFQVNAAGTMMWWVA
jgi:hypothetical protein